MLFVRRWRVVQTLKTESLRGLKNEHFRHRPKEVGAAQNKDGRLNWVQEAGG